MQLPKTRLSHRLAITLQERGVDKLRASVEAANAAAAAPASSTVTDGKHPRSMQIRLLKLTYSKIFSRIVIIPHSFYEKEFSVVDLHLGKAY